MEPLGEKYAIVIGIEHYQDEHITDVPYAENDAREIFRLITEASVDGYKPENVKLLLSSEATRKGLSASISRVFKKVSVNDSVLFFFVGHGEFTGTGGYLVPSDYQRGDDLSTEAFSFTELDTLLRTAKPENFIFFLDTCHCDRTMDHVQLSDDLRSRGARLRVKSDALRLIAPVPGRLVICSCMFDDLSQNVPEKNHGLFTYYLLAGMRGKARRGEDGRMDVTELSAYVSESVAEHGREHGFEPNPLPQMRGQLQGKFWLPLIRSSERESVLQPTSSGQPTGTAISEEGATGEMILTCNRSGLDVLVGGDIQFKSEGGVQNRIPNLLIGEYLLKALDHGTECWSRSVTVTAQQSTLIDIAIDEQKFPENRTWREAYLGMEFVWVPGGTFEMGDLWDEGKEDEKPVHKVRVDGFWMGKYLVTQGQWRRIMGNNPSKFQQGDDYPVESVSWNDVQEFIIKLGTKNENRYVFRLPTEAEWEYACRSRGMHEKIPGGSQLDEVAWYAENSLRSTQKVGQKKSNGLGLFDMLGNVNEWCIDLFAGDYFQDCLEHNKIGPAGARERIFRGGAWCDRAKDIRCAARNRDRESFLSNTVGFRVVKLAKIEMA